MNQSVVTVTDMFCGAGGSSQGAFDAGTEVRLAANHWQLAIETHNTNYPDVDHDCADINQVVPSRWPTTTMLWASPECPHHSNAAGRKRPHKQMGFFDDPEDPAAVRSRATMWDVPRFAEYHDYKAIIVENVVEVVKWRLFDAWIHAMKLLDYEFKLCYLNAQFFGVPQSRDRFFGVFWKKELRMPDLDFHPRAHCLKCDKEVDSVQAWKKPHYHWGRYGPRRQYLYVCPHCGQEVYPYYTPAYVAIDWTDQGTRIGDRDRPLKDKTLARIRRGLEQYGNQYLVIDTAYGRSRGASPATWPLPTQTTGQTQGIASTRARPVWQPLPTQTAQQTQALVVTMRQHCKVRSPEEPLSCITAGGNNHALLRMPFLAVNYSPGIHRAITEPMSCITTVDHHSLVVPEPFVVNYFGHATPVDEPMGTITTIQRHGLAQPGKLPKLDDCYFRMLKPPEIGRGQAFHEDYIVLGTQREQVRQYGNAVPPKMARALFERVTEVL